MRTFKLVWGMAAASAWALAACSSSSPPPASGSSGAFGVVTLGGKQLMYLPIQAPTANGDGQIAVVDVGQAGKGMTGAPALVTDVDLGCAGAREAGFCSAPDFATTTAGDSSVVVAASTQSYRVWFIDPSKNQVTATLSLDPALGGSTFSGGGGIVTGIALDEANHRAILSVWNGFLLVDLDSHSVTGSVTAAGSENFGFDSTRGLVLAPFYNCGSATPGIDDAGNVLPLGDAGFCQSYQVPDGGGVITAGLNVVNLANDKVYTFENLAAADPTFPLDGEPDSAAVDPSSGIAVLPQEGMGQEDFLDLTKAVYDDATRTFTAPLAKLSIQECDGAAVEPKSHLAFFEEEFSDQIALVDLTKLGAGADGGFPPSAVVQSNVPSPPGGSGWENLGDPHGIAVTTGLQSSGPVGFVVSGQGSSGQWVARIDLQKMLTLGQAAAGTLTPAALAPAVTMLDAATKE